MYRDGRSPRPRRSSDRPNGSISQTRAYGARNNCALRLTASSRTWCSSKFSASAEVISRRARSCSRSSRELAYSRAASRAGAARAASRSRMRASSAPVTRSLAIETHDQRADWSIVEHERHGFDRLQSALDAPGDGLLEVWVVVDDNGPAQFDGLAGGALASAQGCVVHGLARVVAVDGQQQVAVGVPQVDADRVATQQRAGVLGHEPTRSAGSWLKSRPGGGRDVVQRLR